MKKRICTLDGKDAERYGVTAAVLLYGIRAEIEDNKAEHKHHHDGRTWTPGGRAALEELYPFLTKHQIKLALNKLVDAGALVVGRYGHAMDQTLWYALGDNH